MSSISYLFSFYCYGDLRDLHSFPTRRSSDLIVVPGCAPWQTRFISRRKSMASRFSRPPYLLGTQAQGRSEEHTSELQSPCNLVCRLLLEKKNNKQIASRRKTGQKTKGIILNV